MAEHPRLLLVESDREVLHVVPPFMRRVGEVLVAPTLSEAHELLERSETHVLVIANCMLDDGGIALLQALRHRNPSAQVMVLCDQHTAEVSAAVLAEGIADTMVKPFDVAGLPPRLTRLVDVMYEQRRRARQQRDLETRMRHHDRIALLGTLVATVAHEVASPLSVVSTNAVLISDVIDGDPSIATRDRACLRLATRDTLEATRVIKEYLTRILKFSRRDDRQGWDEDLADTLRMALLFTKTHGRDRSVQVHVDRLDQLPPVSHHAAALTQAIVNALTNAIDAAPRGGNVWLRVEQTRDHVTVIVEDDGPGLTAEQQKHLCDAFYTTKETGTGLGTVVIQQVTREHGGHVTWKNVGDGRGVSVRLALPRRPSSIPPVERYVSR